MLGLFNWNHMKFEHQREVDCKNGNVDRNECEPSLKEMTEVAIKMLKKNDDGFFLLVEGGKIDHAHHDGKVKFSSKPSEREICFPLKNKTFLKS